MEEEIKKTIVSRTGEILQKYNFNIDQQIKKEEIIKENQRKYQTQYYNWQDHLKGKGKYEEIIRWSAKVKKIRPENQ